MTTRYSRLTRGQSKSIVKLFQLLWKLRVTELLAIPVLSRTQPMAFERVPYSFRDRHHTS